MSHANVTINFFVRFLVISILALLASAPRLYLYEHFPKLSRLVRLAEVPCAAERPGDGGIVGVIRGLVLLADGSGGNARKSVCSRSSFG
jgi:hypothetical protein